MQALSPLCLLDPDLTNVKRMILLYRPAQGAADSMQMDTSRLYQGEPGLSGCISDVVCCHLNLFRGRLLHQEIIFNT